MRFIILFFFIVVSTSCKQDNTRPTADQLLNELNSDTTKTNILPSTTSNLVFKGEIPGLYSIDMHLIIEEQAVRGCYIGEGKTFPIKGALRAKNQLELSVYNESKEVEELFMGTLSDDKKSYKGKWFSIDAGSEKFDFELNQQPLEISNETLSNLTGTYEYTVQDLTSYLIVEAQTNQTLKIQAVTAYGSCTGEIEPSIVYLFNSTQFNFYGDEDCFIHFEMEDNQISIEENICLYYHGSRCSFDGNYRKVSEEVNWILES